MAFDPAQPIAGSYPASAPMRENFQQLSVHHRGAVEPENKSAGFLWWDTSNSSNEKLRGYTGSAWVDLFDHMESSPVPVSAGAVSWQAFVKDKDLSTPPGSPSTGDRYIVAATATGDWTGHEDDIAEWDGSTWVFSTPEGGWATWVEDEGKIYVFNGSSWGNDLVSPHAGTHENEGSDEINVGGLSGVLADPQIALAHVLVSSFHTAAGLTPGDVLTALTETTFGFQAAGGGGVVAEAIDHVWVGSGAPNRVIDLGDNYDFILVWREEDDDWDTDHPAMAYAFRTCYGHFMNQSSPSATSHRAQNGVLSHQSWQGKLFGVDANKIKLGTSGAGNTFNGIGKNYRLFGLKFSSME